MILLNMTKRFNLPLKVALGYAFLVAVLCVAVAFIVSYTRSAILLSDVEHERAVRRDAVNGLVHGLLEVENTERAVCTGQTDMLPDYEQAIGRAQAAADSLVTVLADSTQRARVDTLRMLLGRRRDNTRRLVAVLGTDNGKHLYELTAERLRSGSDSLVVRSSTDKTVREKQVTYVVEKTRPTFLGRLADAFRRSKSDTTSMRIDTLTTTAGTGSRNINVGDTVAGMLDDIGRREKQRSRSRRNRIVESGIALQEAGMALNAHVYRIMQGISRDEQMRMVKAGDVDVARRRATVARIGALAVLAVVLAVVLLALVWRDNRRAEDYRRSLEEARRRAENLLEQRERLLLTITHDIKSPVAAISGFTELLRPHVEGAQPRGFLDNIRSSAMHLLRLVGALLDYHQLEQGRMTVQKVSFSPARLLTDCTESFRPRADEKGLKLSCLCSEESAAVCRGDAFRIRQIAENLTGNALKYTARGSVTVSAGVDGGMLRLSVADTGQGMTEEESRRVFRAFTRLPGAQGIEGVGLGLSITQELVSLLGGNIELDTEPGRGSTFTVTLPVEKETADGEADDGGEAADDDNPQGEKPVPALPESLRILLIDDDALQLQLLTAMLQRLSDGRWSVTACGDIDEMFARIDSEQFDLLLTDIEMPAMNGFEIAARLRNRRLPVVAMTAHGAIQADDFGRAGFTACLRKPVSADRLAGVIAAVISGAVPAEEPPSAEDKAPSQDGLRFDALTAFADGDETAARDILESFHRQTTGSVATLRQACADGDVKTAGELGHRLIPVFTMLGSPAVPLLRQLADSRNGSQPPAGFDALCRKTADELERTARECVKNMEEKRS